MSRPGYDAASFEPDDRAHRRRLAEFTLRANAGKINACLDVTLRASQVTTVVTDSRIGVFTFIDWMPLTAAAAVARPNLWANPTVTGSVTLNHASDAAVDQTFRLLLIG